ncbi:VTC domain-containing protein [Ochrobactrum sp. CM-21-5]|nr:VTC domain-containing protein [Ochrobactrum sp. CM-21-5]
MAARTALSADFASTARTPSSPARSSCAETSSTGPAVRCLRRVFTYETCYFDDSEQRSYFDHHQGRRRRAKVRIRKYANAGLCFVEVKLKDRRGITVKKRLPYEMAKFGVLDDAALDYVHSVYRDHYDLEFPYELSRVLDMRYQRMTLVAKSGGERMTIDNRLQFSSPMSSRGIAADRFIIETKSANGNGTADRILRTLHQHPTKHCSKYCTGVALLYEGTRCNRFLPALRKLGAMPATERMT